MARSWFSQGSSIYLFCTGLLILSIAGCAPSGKAGAGRRAEPPISSVPTVVASTDLRLPLDRYLPSVAELKGQSSAQRTLVRKCMQRFGIDLAAPDPPAAVGLRSWTERRYGLTDVTSAAAHGYGLGERDPGAQPGGGRPRASDLTALGRAVLTGEGATNADGQRIPEGGCAGEVQRLVAAAGRNHPDEALVQRLSLQSFEASQIDLRVREVFARWAECMRAAGYHYSSPLDPPADPRFRKRGSLEEIATAKTDVSCKRLTNLVGVWFAVESAYQRKFIGENRAALDITRPR